MDFQWTLERELKYDLKGSLWMERLKDQSESQKSPKNKLESGALQDQEKGSWINELNAMRSMKKAQVFFLEDLEQEENVFESPVLERLSEKYSLNMYDLVDLLEKERNQIQNKPENLSEKFIQYKEKIIKAIHSFVSEVNKRAIKNQNKNKEKPIITWDTLKDSAYYRVCVDILSLFFEGLNESQELNLNEKKDFSLNQFEKELKKTLGNKIKTVILSKKEKRATLNNRMGVPQKTLQTVSSLEQPNQNQEIKFDKNPSNSESDDSEDKNTVLLHHVGNGFHDVYVPLSEDIKNAPITSSENVENSGKEEINEDLPIFEKIDFKKPYLNKKQQRKSTPKPVEKEKNLTFYSTMLSEYEKLKKCEKLLFSDYLKLLKDLLSCNKTFFNELEFKNIRGTHITFKLSQKNGKPITWEFSRVGGGRYIPQNFNYRQWYLKPFEILGISKENFHEYKK